MNAAPKTTRAQHLQWCKDRAMEYVNKGDNAGAISSMLGDLGKHPETMKSAEVGMMLAMTVRDTESAKRFVLGFN